MNINNLKQNLLDLIQDECFIKINICIGNIKNNFMNHNINHKTYNTYLNFIRNKVKNKKNEYIKKYYYKDMILICNNKNKYCVKNLPSQFINYKINKTKYNKNISNIRVKIKNQRLIDIINFPSIKNYFKIENLRVQTFNSKYKNSELYINFIENDNNLSIEYSSNIDIKNIDNFISNLSYILGKLYFSKVILEK